MGDKNNLPKHVAIIMDGNRRWARKRGLGPIDGHKQALDTAIEPLIDKCLELGIGYITFWAWSTENWKRDRTEVTGVMRLLSNGLRRNVKRFYEKGVRLRYLGDLSKFSKFVQEKTRYYVDKSKDNRGLTVTFALNYGGRDEIVRAIKKILSLRLKVEQINEQLVSEFLDTKDMPDPDLIIRTGGERRMSGFLPWQSVYSEFYFTPVLFPDFSVEHFEQALADYANRDRRFGGGKFEGYV